MSMADSAAQACSRDFAAKQKLSSLVVVNVLQRATVLGVYCQSNSLIVAIAPDHDERVVDA